MVRALARRLAVPAAAMSTSTPAPAARIAFASFDVTPQVFHTTRTAAALVNLKPLVPGHVLVIPRTARPARLAEMPAHEVGALFEAVHAVARVVERAYGAQGLSVAVQDGHVAGQTVPHVHVHILPRRTHDFTPNDALYPLLERFGLSLADAQRRGPAPASASGDAPAQAAQGGAGPDNENRQPRTAEQMRAEAQWLARFFTEGQSEGTY